MTTVPLLRPGSPPQRVLCFAPHPDDEVVGVGGSLHLHGLAGDPVQVILATDGTAGDPQGKYPPGEYGELRRGESRRAAALLGLGEPEFWGLGDGCEVSAEDRVQVTDMIAGQIRGFEPDLVYLPWAADSHPDHLVLHQIVLEGLRVVDFRGLALGYEIWAPLPAPHWVVDITDVVDKKRDALACFETQLAYTDLAHAVFGLNGYRSMLLERSGGYGEAFQQIDLQTGPVD